MLNNNSLGGGNTQVKTGGSWYLCKTSPKTSLDFYLRWESRLRLTPLCLLSPHIIVSGAFFKQHYRIDSQYSNALGHMSGAYLSVESQCPSSSRVLGYDTPVTSFHPLGMRSLPAQPLPHPLSQPSSHYLTDQGGGQPHKGRIIGIVWRPPQAPPHPPPHTPLSSQIQYNHNPTFRQSSTPEQILNVPDLPSLSPCRYIPHGKLHEIITRKATLKDSVAMLDMEHLYPQYNSGRVTMGGI